MSMFPLRRLTAALLTAVLAAALSTTAVAGPAAASGTEVGQTGPCYRSPSICLSYDYPTETLTAFSMYDVTGTGTYLTIYNVTSGGLLQTCTTGMSCQVRVRPPFGWCTWAKAYIGGWSYTAPPPSVVRESATVYFCRPM